MHFKDGKFYSIPLPKPLQPTPYVPRKPVPKPRTKQGRTLIPLQRTPLPRKVTEKVQKLIDEIAPYYAPARITKCKNLLKFIPKVEI